MQHSNIVISAGISLLLFTSAAVAYGDSEDMHMVAPPLHAVILNKTLSTDQESYFQYGEHTGLLAAHILLMTASWVFVLPIGVLLSISRSRFALPTQFGFLLLNTVGISMIVIYNASTPDLYPHNAHHKLGWILNCVMCAQILMGVIGAYVGRSEAYISVSAQAIAEHERMQLRNAEQYCFSNDSGQGTEPNSESLRRQSISSTSSDELPDARHGNEDEEEESLMHNRSVDKVLKHKLSNLLSYKFLRVFIFMYDAVDRIILILVSVAMMTGIITCGGFFIGSQVFSGLAHLIKGGIFFWYGILTLGRWTGCFSEIGWAWNISPSKKRHLSAEFVESFLIFFYGSTNVFLEHLGSRDDEWTARDLEHISITLMFLGGGLCGMLIDSITIRSLLNTTRNSSSPYNSPDDILEPRTYPFSMNPIPALIVLLLGIIISSHHQDSMLSTMIHKQWGTLFVGAAFARGATYILMFISPPTSIFPGRPPTELITAFCLMAGGMIFMASAQDTVMAMESHALDAMFFFTVSMGVVTFLMAWVITVIAVKGAAVRRENDLVDRPATDDEHNAIV